MITEIIFQNNGIKRVIVLFIKNASEERLSDYD